MGNNLNIQREQLHIGTIVRITNNPLSQSPHKGKVGTVAGFHADRAMRRPKVKIVLNQAMYIWVWLSDVEILMNEDYAEL